MNKKLIIILAVAAILIVGGFFAYKSQKGKTGGNSITNQVGSGAKSLKDLISAGVPQKCTYSTSDSTFSSEGTTYVSGGKVRGDFSTVSEGKTTVSHMISDGKTSYIWTEGQKTGFKMTVEDTDATSAPTTNENGSFSGGDMNQQYDYKCSAWIADSSVFNPPADVTFSDFSNMFGSTTSPTSESENSTQCSVCNSLTGDDKTQCLSALNCN